MKLTSVGKVEQVLQLLLCSFSKFDLHQTLGKENIFDLNHPLSLYNPFSHLPAQERNNPDILENTIGTDRCFFYCFQFIRNG